jgi:hypothetical protein
VLNVRSLPSALDIRAIVVRCSLATALVVGALETARLAVFGGTVRLALTACLLVLFAGVWALRPSATLYLVLVWTVALGLVRRVVSYKLVGAGAGSDILLLVEPCALFLLLATVVRSGAAAMETRMAKAVAALVVLIGFGALNPLQGSVTAGFAALIFFVPILAFWIGRELVDDALFHRLLALLALLALGAVAYGVGQLALGFPSWDGAWIANQGYRGLNVGGVVRQFSSFSAASDYAYFLAVAAVVWAWVNPLRVSRTVAVGVGTGLVVALFYESSRGVLFTLVGTFGVLVAASRGMRLRSALVTGVAAVFLLPVVVSQVTSGLNVRAAHGSNQALVAHQVNGLIDPTGSQSTLPAHFTLIVDGLKSAFANPVGEGISLVTIAGAKFGGGTQGTEADISNAAVALGLPGLALYLFIAWTGFAGAYRLAVARRDPLAYAALGLLMATVFQWLNGGQYAVAYLPWLALGWVDRRLKER